MRGWVIHHNRAVGWFLVIKMKGGAEGGREGGRTNIV